MRGRQSCLSARVSGESMQPTDKIYTNGPVTGSEAVALKTLSEKLTQQGGAFLVFSNVTIRGRQIDFIVVTEQRVAHLELKHFARPLECAESGPWYTLSVNGSRTRIPCAGRNTV